MRFFKRLIKSALGLLFFVTIVGACGFSVSGLLTTLGLGGAALALASKDSLANLFGSVSLISDSVFKVGDSVKINDNIEGVVEDIGLRSTKIRTYSHSLITIPNAVLSNMAIDNLSQVDGKFVNQKLFFKNVDNPDEMADFIDGLSARLKNYSDINSVSVLFFDFTQNGLQVLITYFIPANKCDKYTDIRGEINQIILQYVQSSGLSLLLTDN